MATTRFPRSTEALATAREQLRASQDDEERRVLIRGGKALSMDSRVGDLGRGDRLVHGRRIEAVAPDLGDAASDGGCIVVPADDMIVLPGLQDTHRHSWQTH